MSKIYTENEEKSMNRIKYPLKIVLAAAMTLMPFAMLNGAGTTAADFLKIPVGVRNVAMGETGAAASDVNSAYYNPAGLGWLTKPELTFAHSQQIQDVTFEHVAGILPVTDWGSFGFSMYYQGMSDIQGYDASGHAISKVGAYSGAAALSYGKYILGERIEGDGLTAGMTLKYIFSKLDTARGNAFGGDAGAMYTFKPSQMTLDNQFAVGASVVNLGTGMKFDTVSDTLPMGLRFGMLYKFLMTKMNPVLMLDVNKYKDSDVTVGIGGEITIKDILALRAGYVSKGSRDTDTGIRFGVGLKSYGLSFDYAYSGLGDLGTVHRFGLSVNFDTRSGGDNADASRIFQHGIELFNQERYLEATLEFNKVLEIDPTNKEALKYMQDANKKLEEKK